MINKEFKRGFKNAFSFSPNDRTRERVPLLSAEERIRQSWDSVGSDIRKSMDKIDIELNRVKETT